MFVRDGRGEWPSLPYESWADTCETLHMWLQIIGKVRLAMSPKCNQWWNVPLYVTARGLTTSVMPYGHRSVEARFDFVDHVLTLETSDGSRRTLRLEPCTVADFFQHVRTMLNDLGLDVPIWSHPVEVVDPIPFERDTIHRSYDRDAVHRFWTITREIEAVLERFRARFRGKSSPVHFFWGSFDLAVSRFAGRLAPPRPNADPITTDAYDEEVSSVGFWPGDATHGGPYLYSYFVPEPDGFASARIDPPEAFYSADLKEFLLPYDIVRRAPDPDKVILSFAESAYLAGATRAGWDVEALRYKHADAEPSIQGDGWAAQPPPV